MTEDGIRGRVHAAQVSVGRCEPETLSIAKTGDLWSDAWNQTCSVTDPFPAFSGW